ncbi:MAG: hypothetical protein WC474_11690, partial [Hydrogenophilaceae bacterium]
PITVMAIFMPPAAMLPIRLDRSWPLQPASWLALASLTWQACSLSWLTPELPHPDAPCIIGIGIGIGIGMAMGIQLPCPAMAEPADKAAIRANAFTVLEIALILDSWWVESPAMRGWSHPARQMKVRNVSAVMKM